VGLTTRVMAHFTTFLTTVGKQHDVRVSNEANRL